MFGSDIFSVCVLDEMRRKLGSRLDVSVITPPDRPRSKNQALPLKHYALENQLPVVQPDSSVNFRMDGFEFANGQTGFESPFDVAVVASFGYMIPARFMHRFPLGMLNVHPSLLPAYRGAAPIQHQIDQQIEWTGVTVVSLHPHRIDAGEIIDQHVMVRRY